MKFNKLLSAAMISATVLATAAPVSTFAATQEGNADANGGTALPQKDTSTVGISFGDNTNNGNTGYLRLQMVPHILDFGNHTVFDSQYPTFTADGKNLSKDDNNRYPNYKNGNSNMTALLNTTDTALKDVNGKVWATVVDKQVTRTTTDTKNDNVAGSWTLSVQSDSQLVAKTDGGNNSSTAPIADATLIFKNTSSAQTQDVFGLTQEDQDSTYAKDLAAINPAPIVKAVGTVSKNVSLKLEDNGAKVQVAAAGVGEGQGADVFAWKNTDVQLTLPKTATVNNAIYESKLTWTLATGIA